MCRWWRLRFDSDGERSFPGTPRLSKPWARRATAGEDWGDRVTEGGERDPSVLALDTRVMGPFAEIWS